MRLEKKWEKFRFAEGNCVRHAKNKKLPVNHNLKEKSNSFGKHNFGELRIGRQRSESAEPFYIVFQRNFIAFIVQFLPSCKFFQQMSEVFSAFLLVQAVLKQIFPELYEHGTALHYTVQAAM